jgi:hypothetical protein
MKFSLDFGLGKNREQKGAESVDQANKTQTGPGLEIKKDVLVKEIEKILGEKFKEFFPKEAIKVDKKEYLSKRAESFGLSSPDRTIYTIPEENNAMTLIVTGKFSEGSRYEMVIGGADMRPTTTFVGKFDGKGKSININLNTGEKNEIEDDTLEEFIQGTEDMVINSK